MLKQNKTKYFHLLSVIILLLNTVIVSQNTSYSKIYNRKKILVSEGTILDDKMYGVWRSYNDSLGYLAKIETYDSDFLNGTYIEFNQFGNIVCTGYYSKSAKKDSKKYIEKLKGYAYFTEALPVGNWFYYDNNNKLIKREVYNKKGKLKNVYNLTDSINMKR